MDTEESTSVTMVTQPTQRPRTPGILPPTILPLTVPPKQSTPSRARYQLEIPKLTMPSRVPAIRASISQSPGAFQSPVFKVPTNRPRSNFQIPTLAISTPPRPCIPLLHTPVQQRPRLLSFTPPTARSTPQVTLSTPNIRPTVSTLATSQSSSAVQTPTTTVPQAGHNQAPMQPSSLSKPTNNVGIEIQDSVAEMDNQTLQQESSGFELSNTSQESTSFATLFTSDSGQECTDYAGDFGQTGNYQESSVNDQQQLEVCQYDAQPVHFICVLSFFFPCIITSPTLSFFPLSPLPQASFLLNALSPILYIVAYNDCSNVAFMHTHSHTCSLLEKMTMDCFMEWKALYLD